ncbi:MAG: FAD-dependent oxidoreductase [Campylobacterales bacterium]|nr:FAD-dependent oxidoreductase [Campylobacterales bacterium]
MKSSKQKRLVIVGAGVSGLYLAYLLQEEFHITILEARERVGGRIFSIKGHDMGPSWVWPHHTEVLSLIEHLDLQLFRQYTKGYALYDVQGRVERFDTPASMPSFRVEGSLSTLISALHEKLQDVKLHCNESVEAIKVQQECVQVKTTKEVYESEIVISTLPPRLTAKLHFSPSLEESVLTRLKATQTWMGNSAKCVIEFKTAFWREKGLSGFTFSHIGPLGEIHDASTTNSAALFGFVNLHADMKNFTQNVKEQMIRLFDIDEEEIINIYLVDWKREVYTSVQEDAKSLSAHPQYGIDMSSYSHRVFFSATEFSYEEGGYIEGAIRQAKKISKEILIMSRV